MTLVIDGQQIDYLEIDDLSMERLYIDDVLVFQGPEPGAIGRFTLLSRPNPAIPTNFGYSLSNGFGDLDPKEFNDVIISSIVDRADQGDFLITIDSAVDLGQDFFYIFAIHKEVGQNEFYTDDAVFTFTGTSCHWSWPVDAQLGDADYPCLMYEKPNRERVVDYVFLPGTSSNGVSVGYTSNKYTNDTFGDLEPPNFNGQAWGVILENDTNGVMIGFEDQGVAPDFWREIQWPQIGVTLQSADGIYSTDTNGSFWSFPAADPEWISGINYQMRVRGPTAYLFAFELDMDAGLEFGSIPAQQFVGYSTVNQLDMGEINPSYYKNQYISSIMDDTDGRFVVTMGAVNLPQSYWELVVVQPGDIRFLSRDMLFNNVGDEPAIEPNTWTHPTEAAGFIDGQSYEVTFFGDNQFIPFAVDVYTYEGKWSGGDVGLEVNLQPDNLLRGLPIKNMQLYKGTFAIVLEGEDKLQTFWKTLRIPQLDDYRIDSADMLYDRTSFPGKLIWYTDKNLPLLKDGQSYFVQFFA